MIRSAELHKAGWADFFIERELHHFPVGVDRYFMLVLGALASFLGTLSLSLGAVAPLVLKSQNLSANDYGHVVGGVGMAGAIIGLTAAHLADKYGRMRVLLWGMIPVLVLHFAMAFMPDRQPALFFVLYAGMAFTEAWAIVVVSALLRDFSPRTGRALAVGLVTVGTIAANWFSTFLAGHVLDSVGTWQHMFLIYGFVAVGVWLLLLLFGREPSAGYRAQVIYSLDDKQAVDQRRTEIEASGVHVDGFWRYITADWRLWALATAQSLFLLGYTTFVAYGPLFTVQGFHQTPQEASNVTSWIYASIIVFLIFGGLLSDWLHLRKGLAVFFCALTGIALIGLGLAVGADLSSTQVIFLYIGVGAAMAMMWSPANALFSEAAEDIHATRQTTAFGGQRVFTAIIPQTWIFILPSLLSDHGWEPVWVITGIAAFGALPIMAMARGNWLRWSVPERAIELEPQPVSLEPQPVPLEPQPVSLDPM
jgi:OPA family glycerol-3-phosphate transporter-like MFS transporter